MSAGRRACAPSERSPRQASARGIPEGAGPLTASIAFTAVELRATGASNTVGQGRGCAQTAIEHTPYPECRAFPDGSTISPRPDQDFLWVHAHFRSWDEPKVGVRLASRVLARPAVRYVDGRADPPPAGVEVSVRDLPEIGSARRRLALDRRGQAHYVTDDVS